MPTETPEAKCYWCKKVLVSGLRYALKVDPATGDPVPPAAAGVVRYVGPDCRSKLRMRRVPASWFTRPAA